MSAVGTHDEEVEWKTRVLVMGGQYVLQDAVMASPGAYNRGYGHGVPVAAVQLGQTAQAVSPNDAAKRLVEGFQRYHQSPRGRQRRYGNSCLLGFFHSHQLQPPAGFGSTAFEKRCRVHPRGVQAAGNTKARVNP